MGNVTIVFSDRVWFGLLLTLLAGLATGFGSCIAFFFNRTGRKSLALALGFSGGVMIYISLVELLASSQAALSGIYGKTAGQLAAAAAFFGGIAFSMLIDRLIPAYENPHEVRTVEEMDHPVHRDRMFRSGVLFALAITIHNFPEGMAVFMASLSTPETGIAIALAIAIHNIPEGITVSVPLYHATGSRRKAFLWSFLSGLAEPLGAVTAWLFLAPWLSTELMNFVFAAVAGIMVYISFDELLPLAEEYGEHHYAIYGLIGGMLVMALALAL
ncbi:Zinc transporter ZupT [bioreactor metagenome]|uniref:Zinc transporter ZupT n=1 Tax=bioreactor metagenome TaxID=1076179 RepID=A0A644Y6F8_9ZZZZ